MLETPLELAWQAALELMKKEFGRYFKAIKLQDQVYTYNKMYLKRLQNREVELDYGGLDEYFRNEFFKDIRDCVFCLNLEEEEQKKKDIISRCCKHSGKADDTTVKLMRELVEHTLRNLRDMYLSRIDDEYKILLANQASGRNITHRNFHDIKVYDVKNQDTNMPDTNMPDTNVQDTPVQNTPAHMGAAYCGGQDFLEYWRGQVETQEKEGRAARRIDTNTLRVPSAESRHNIKTFQLEKAPKSSFFEGREDVLDKLEAGMLGGHASLILLYGLGGMGKTTVASYIARKVKDNYEYVIWQPLQDAPEAGDIFAAFIQFFSGRVGGEYPEDIISRMEALIRYLTDNRCLLIFDNAESVLSEEYPLHGRQIYERLIKELACRDHKSCVLITSREKPEFIARLENPDGTVRCMELPGLSSSAIRRCTKGWNLTGCDEDWDNLVSAYSGNPLLLNIAANAIRQDFHGNINEFLKDYHNPGSTKIISETIERLTPDEYALLRWLSLRSPRGIREIGHLMEMDLGAGQVMEAVQKLQRKAMVVSTQEGLAVQNVIMENVLERIADSLVQAVRSSKWNQLKEFAALEASGPDYAGDNQVRNVVAPAAAKLYASYKSWKPVKKMLSEMLSDMRCLPYADQGYAPGNIINLLIYCNKQEMGTHGRSCDRDVNLTGSDFSGLALQQVSFVDAQLQNVNFAGSYFEGTVFRETMDLPTSCAFSRDKSRFAIGDVEGNFSIWDSRSFKKLRSVHGHKSTIYGIAYGDDDRILITASHDRTIRCWDAHSLNILFRPEIDRVSNEWNCLDAGNGLIAAAGNDKTIHLWTADGGHQAFTSPHWGTLHSIRIAPDESCIIAGDSRGNVCRISLISHEDREPVTVKAHEGQVASVSFHPTDGTFVTGGMDGRILMWTADMRYGCLPSNSAHSGFVTGLAFGMDGRILISSGHDRTIRVWERQEDTGTFLVISTLYGHKSRINSMAFSGDGRTLLSCSDDICLRIWDLKKSRCISKVTGYCGWISSMRFIHGGAMLAAASADGTVRIWNYPEGILKRTLGGHDERVNPLAVDSSESMVAAGAQNGRILIWGIMNAGVMKELKGHSGAIRGLAFLGDGGRLISASYDGTVRYWEIDRHGNVEGRILSKEFPGWLGALAVDKTGCMLAYTLTEGRIRIINADTMEEIWMLRTQSEEIQTVSFSEDGCYLGAGGSDGRLYLWRTGNWQLCAVPHPDKVHISSIAFSPDGKSLAIAGGKGILKLWSVPECREIKTICTSEQSLHCVIFTEDGRRVLTSGTDGIIRTWALSGLEPVGAIRNPRPYEGMKLKGALGLTPIQLQTLRILGADVEEGEDGIEMQ